MLGIPVLRALASAWLWFTPLTLAQLRRWLNIVEVLTAWSTLDAFVVIAGSVVLQITPLTSAIIGYALKDALGGGGGAGGLVGIEARFLPVGFTLAVFALILPFVCSLTLAAACRDHVERARSFSPPPPPSPPPTGHIRY